MCVLMSLRSFVKIQGTMKLVPHICLVTFAQLAHSASVSSLCGPSQPALLSPPEPFRRAQRPHGQLGGQLGVRQSKRFSSADDVFRASLLRHSLPAKPPRFVSS